MPGAYIQPNSGTLPEKFTPQTTLMLGNVVRNMKMMLECNLRESLWYFVGKDLAYANQRWSRATEN